jgi:type II secretory pathway pseudopilin PulG
MNLPIATISGGCRFGKGRARGAFTFAEVLAAMLFMAIVIPVAMQGMQLANRAGVVAYRKSVAIRLADQQLNELLTLGTWQGGGQNGSFMGRYQSYRWRLTQETWTDPNMLLLTMEVSYLVQNQEYQVRLSTLVPEATP